MVTDVRRSTRRPGGIRTLLAVDQEGGQVQRLQGPGFAEIPSAEQQAERSDARLAATPSAGAEDLAAVGIDADLAPVADVVPADLGDANAPDRPAAARLRLRPRVRSRPRPRAFVRGMDRAGIATAVKHFPGLGRVRGNTDYARRVVDRQTTRDGAGVAAFGDGDRRRASTW